MNRAEEINKLLEGSKAVIHLKKSPTISSQQLTDEVDATLVRGGVTGDPDFNKYTITVDKKDLAKAKKILDNDIYKGEYTVK